MKNNTTPTAGYKAILSQLDEVPERPRLVAVSKRQPAEAISHIHHAGQIDFAENYVSEALEKLKHPSISTLKLCWHFIGPIQRNKTRDIATHFDWVQSVDRLIIAERLSRQRPDSSPPLQVLIQVNVDDEAQKAGVHPADIMPLAAFIDQQSSLELRGIMGIPQNTDIESKKTISFTRLQECFYGLQQHFKSIDTLSMGMSSDWKLAITHGSTMIRLGTSLFGNRD